MNIQKRSAGSILNIIGSLQGTAWRLVENSDLSKIDGDTAFDNLMLDNAFQCDARVRLPQDFDGYLSHLSWKPGETLLSFITNHDEKLRKVEEHGTKIPDEVLGRLLLKKANVTGEQRRLWRKLPNLKSCVSRKASIWFLDRITKLLGVLTIDALGLDGCFAVVPMWLRTTMSTTRAITMRARIQCCLEGDFVRSDLVLHCYQVHNTQFPTASWHLRWRPLDFRSFRSSGTFFAPGCVAELETSEGSSKCHHQRIGWEKNLQDFPWIFSKKSGFLNMFPWTNPLTETSKV